MNRPQLKAMALADLPAVLAIEPVTESVPLLTEVVPV